MSFRMHELLPAHGHERAADHAGGQGQADWGAGWDGGAGTLGTCWEAAPSSHLSYPCGLSLPTQLLLWPFEQQVFGRVTGACSRVTKGKHSVPTASAQRCQPCSPSPQPGAGAEGVASRAQAVQAWLGQALPPGLKQQREAVPGELALATPCPHPEEPTG